MFDINKHIDWMYNKATDKVSKKAIKAMIVDCLNSDTVEVYNDKFKVYNTKYGNRLYNKYCSPEVIKYANFHWGNKSGDTLELHLANRIFASLSEQYGKRIGEAIIRKRYPEGIYRLLWDMLKDSK